MKKDLLILVFTILTLNACTKQDTAAIETSMAATSEESTSLPETYWSLEQARTVLDQTAEIRLDTDYSHLKQSEQKAIKELLLAGIIMNDLYEVSRHPQALEARANLEALNTDSRSSEHTQALMDLYYQVKGPIARTLDNQRVPFLPVDEKQKGGNLYPWGMSDEDRESFLKYLNSSTEIKTELKHLRSVVRKNTKENVKRDLAILEKIPTKQLAYHPNLKTALQTLLTQAEKSYYALPYSIHFHEKIQQAVYHLRNAATAIENDDPAFANYLQERALDLLKDDYMAGDAAWVTGRYKNLNAQIGSYETYDDSLLGVKTYFSLNVLLKNQTASETLAAGIKDLQSIHNALPYQFDRKINTNLAVNVYDVIADFGQARGANTATILPNEAEQSERYGRTIMLRHNIMTNPTLFNNTQAAFAAVVIPSQANDLSVNGQFQRTLWHEVGHYLGVDKTLEGKDLDASLEDVSDLYEEMKADLVSLFSVNQFHTEKKMDDLAYRNVLAGGIRRTLQKVEPKRSSPYGTMQLMQFNYFMENGALSFDPKTQLLTIDYKTYPGVAKAMLADALRIQAEGNIANAKEYVERWGYWKPEIHQVLADKMNAASQFRFTRVRYQALEDLMQEIKTN